MKAVHQDQQAVESEQFIELQSQLSQVQKENEELRTKLAESIGGMQLAQSQAAAAQTQLTDEIDRLNQTIAQLNRASSDANAQLQQMMESHETLKSQQALNEERIAKLNAENEELNRVVDETKGENTQLQAA